MGLLRLGVDYEFPTKTWWEAGGRELWEAICHAGESGVVLEATLAESWLEQARAIPGWNEGPEYAPHPIAVSPAEAEDDELI